MNEPQIFSYCGKNVRTSWKDGELWWVLKDICEVLGISNSRDIAARLEEDKRVAFQSTPLAASKNSQ
ncbi:hypothetical protein FACS189472_17950 [Alphaproteobacteria bacterium]|nr:hypothetical protein FACS189472_17950 [Alphaproteobacteria bacterium]